MVLSKPAGVKFGPCNLLASCYTSASVSLTVKLHRTFMRMERKIYAVSALSLPHRMCLIPTAIVIITVTEFLHGN